MQVHEREQGTRLGDRAHRMLGQEGRQPDGLVAQLDADRLRLVRGEIPLVEEQVQHGVHARQSGPQRDERRRLDVAHTVAQPIACPREPLVDVRLGGEEAQGDFRDAEAAQRLQRQDHSRVAGNRLIAADEEHAQHVVRHLAREAGRRRMIRAFSGGVRRPLENPEPAGPLPQLPHQVVVGHAVQPGARIIWNAIRGPGRERGQECSLHRVLHDVEMARPDSAREQGHESAVLVPEEVLDQVGHGPATSRISMLDPGISIGMARATSSARSKLSADTNI